MILEKVYISATGRNINSHGKKWTEHLERVPKEIHKKKNYQTSFKLL
jgi:hypothetical protein